MKEIVGGHRFKRQPKSRHRSQYDIKGKKKKNHRNGGGNLRLRGEQIPQKFITSWVCRGVVKGTE